MAEFSGSINYQEIFRQLPDNFLLISPDGKILDDSTSHEEVALKKREEVVGLDFFDAYPVADKNEADAIRKSHDAVRNTLQPDAMPIIRYDLEQTNAEGKREFVVRYWQAIHYPILNENGELMYILQRTKDITTEYEADQKNKAVEAELAESEERTKFIVESLPVMIWTTKPDGGVDYFNKRWLAFTGEDFSNQSGDQWAEFVHEDDRQRVLDKWRDAVNTKSDFQVEYRLLRKDGTYRWLLNRGIPRINSEGEVTMWVGGGIDIHDQKTMVQELVEVNEQQALLSDQLQEAYQLAETQRDMYFNIFMQAPAAITILRGKNHKFDFINPGYQALFPHKELKGKSVAEALPEVVEQGFVDILDNVFNTGETFYAKEIPIMLERGDGNLKQCYFNLTYQQYKETGKKAGIAVFAFEVTDLVTSRQELERLRGTSNNAQ